MKSWVSNLVLILLFLLPSGGCTIYQQGTLYDLQTRNVILVDSKIKGNRGIIEATLPNGIHCRGECVTGREGFITSGGSYSPRNWGDIYGFGFTSSSTNVPISQRGVGFVICDDGVTMDCEYKATKSTFSFKGYGICRDNKEKYYRLIF